MITTSHIIIFVLLVDVDGTLEYLADRPQYSFQSFPFNAVNLAVGQRHDALGCWFLGDEADLAKDVAFFELTDYPIMPALFSLQRDVLPRFHDVKLLVDLALADYVLILMHWYLLDQVL